MKNQTAISRVAAFLFALCLVFCSAHSAFAVGGNGDGTGGGKDQPLVLASSSIANGSENVSQNPEIVLTFSKNVVHFTVRDNNKKCFSMTDEDGKSVPINVLMGDDQVDPSIKRIVTIVPQSTLTPGTTYLLKIGGGITSKSGASIGKDSYISFTTEGEKPAATTKSTTTKSTTTKPTTTKPTTTKTATTKPTTTAPTVTVPAATVESTATPAAPTTEVFEVLSDDAEEESTEASDGVEAPQEAAAADDSALALEVFLQNDEPSSTTSAATETTGTTDAAVSDDMQRAFQNLRLYLLILGISIIAVLAVILIIKLKNHKKG